MVQGVVQGFKVQCGLKSAIADDEGREPRWIFLKDDALPVTVHQPAPKQVHWQAGVKEDIERYIRLRVLGEVAIKHSCDLL